MSQVNTDECFLLHQRSYGETSLISEVFTRKKGKMSLIAKGAKNPKSKFFGFLVTFCKLNVTYSGRSYLKTLTSIDRDLTNFNKTLSKKTYNRRKTCGSRRVRVSSPSSRQSSEIEKRDEEIRFAKFRI